MVATQNFEHIMEDLVGSDQVIGRRMLTEALDWRAAAQSNKTFCFVKKSLDKEDRWRNLSYKQIADAVNRMAWWIRRTLGPAHTKETLAYMANNDVRYIIFCLGAVKAGYTALLSSPRNSIEGHLHLLKTLESNKFFWSRERHSKVAPIQDAMPGLETWEIPSLEALLEGPPEPFPHDMSFTKNIDDVAIYVHSSGSTGLPKPVRITHGYFAALDAHSILPPPPDGRRTIMGTINVDDRTFCMLPFFHLSGFFAFSESIWRQLPFAICPDKSPSTEQIVDMILDIQATRVTFLPSLIEGIVRSDRGAQVIRQLRELHYGGAPLPPSIGDNLCKLTKVISGYGATEMGNVAGLMPKDPEDWNCCEWHPEMGIEMEEVDKSGLFEFVMYRKEHRTFQCTFHAFPELQVYRSNDLFSKHPTKPDRWIFQGRRDDVIVLNNGEKFNPSLMEDTISRDPLVRAAIIVGHGRFQSALIVDPDYTMWTEDVQESTFIDRIWPSVVEANRVGPTHATVTKPMIFLASKSKPFVITGKGTIQRKKVLEEYSEEIDRLYEKDGVEEIGDLAPVATLEQMQVYVRNALSNVLENPDLTDSSDIFESGADSLHIIRLSTALQTAVQRAHPDKDYLSINAQGLYTRRTISRIAQFLLSVVNNDNSTEAAPETEEMRVERMQRVAEKYIQNLPMKHAAMPPFPQAYNVVLTGSTGSLGSYLLHQLLHQRNVATIYCLNRSDDAPARQKQSFANKGLEWGDRSAKVVFWQARYGDEKLGLSDERYEELLASVAVVIHNAWKVDFNHVLDTFEHDHVRGVRRLVDFSLAGHHRAHICFVSSISSVGRWDDGRVTRVPERPLWDPRIATKSGYGESKHIAERILTEAASVAGVPATILRVGQVSGPTTSQGEWNRTEWLPVIVLSSQALGLIPDSLQNMTVDWIPVDLLARIIIELVYSGLSSQQERRLSVFHLVNPTVVPWDSLIPTIQKRFPAEKVSFPAWIDSLSKVKPSKETIAKVPALKLLDFFRGNASSSEKLPLLDLVQTRQASATFRELKEVDIALMVNYLNQWGL